MSTNKLSDELLAAFIDGTISVEETKKISQMLQDDPEAFSEYRLAAKAAFIADDNSDAEVKLPADTNWNIAAGIASAMATGAGVSGILSQLNHSPAFGDHPNFYDQDDRSVPPEDSITENSNQSTMNTSHHPEGLNPVQQQYNDTCAIKSQQLILNNFGVPVTEDQLVQQAEQFDLYAPGSGTQPEDVGKLLELNGVHCTQHENATVYDLTSALARGQEVIIGVDSSELWDKGMLSEVMNKFDDLYHGEQADHALIVAGIDTSDPGNVEVILTDPGTGEEAARYPMDRFLDAWHDSGNFMVTTDAPAPLSHNPEMINFDYSAGHLPLIGQMPYDYFDQAVLPLSHEIGMDSHAMDLLHHDFSAMMDGDRFSFSPDLITALDNIPDIHSDSLSFGSQHMADYYNDWAKHHEQLAQYDIEHGNTDSAQNHLRYADDCHDHAMDEMDDVDDDPTDDN